MAGEWQETSLGDLIDVKHGFAFQGEFIRDEPRGDILLTPGNFAIDGGFKADRFKYYDGPVPDEFVLAEGDLLVTMTDLSKQSDTLGFPAFVPAPQDTRRYLHNQRLGKVFVKNERALELEYLHYLLCSADYRHEVLASATGTTVKHTSPERIKRFKFSLPPLSEQRSIGHILGTLDDKIKLNRSISETLEATAQTLFKSWFVDFDPVRAKAEGRDPGLPKEIADLFPTGFVESELGEIPEGWESRGLGQCLSLLKDGSHNPPKRVQEGIRFIAGATDIKHFSVDFAKCTYISEDDCRALHRKWSVMAGDVLLTIVGTVGNVALVAQSDLPFSLQRSIAVLRPGPELSSSFLYCFLNSAPFKADMESCLNPTAQPGIYLGTLAAIPICLPAQRVVMAFDTNASSAFTKMQNAVQETLTLTGLRDTLLPKLISGELRVKDAQRLVEKVA